MFKFTNFFFDCCDQLGSIIFKSKANQFITMYANPSSLRDLCMNFVCNNIEIMIYVTVQNNGTDSPVETVEFINKNMYLPAELSETILTRLSSENKLNDRILSLFSDKNVCLRFVIIF